MDSRSPLPRRVIPALLIMLVAVAALLALVGQAATGTETRAGAAQPIGASAAVAAQPSAHDHQGTRASAVITASQLAFRNDMRKLWEDHVTWTRMVIVSFAAAGPGRGRAATAAQPGGHRRCHRALLRARRR